MELTVVLAPSLAMKGIAVLLALVCLAVGEDAILGTWHSWKNRHRKVYSSAEEETRRMETWLGNLHEISRHNSLENQAFELKLNQFADMVSSSKKLIFFMHKTNVLSLER